MSPPPLEPIQYQPLVLLLPESYLTAPSLLASHPHFHTAGKSRSQLHLLLRHSALRH